MPSEEQLTEDCSVYGQFLGEKDGPVFIKNKLEKTFIDFYLLEEYDEACRYIEPD